MDMNMPSMEKYNYLDIPHSWLEKNLKQWIRQNATRNNSKEWSGKTLSWTEAKKTTSDRIAVSVWIHREVQESQVLIHLQFHGHIF